MAICPCGYPNPDGATVCPQCGSPLPGTAAVQSESPACQPQAMRADADKTMNDLLLEDVRSHDVIEVSAPGGIIGRAGDFSPDSFSSQVSGVHLVAECAPDTGWTIEHVGRNASYVNAAGEWTQLPYGIAWPLHGGELLRIADMLFRTHLKACSTVSDPDEGRTAPEARKDTDDETGRWSITCPVCGTVYPVEGPDARIARCPNCVDALDGARIARTPARRA